MKTTIALALGCLLPMLASAQTIEDVWKREAAASQALHRPDDPALPPSPQNVEIQSKLDDVQRALDVQRADAGEIRRELAFPYPR